MSLGPVGHHGPGGGRRAAGSDLPAPEGERLQEGCEDAGKTRFSGKVWLKILIYRLVECRSDLTGCCFFILLLIFKHVYGFISISLADMRAFACYISSWIKYECDFNVYCRSQWASAQPVCVLNAHGCLSRPPGGKEHDVTGAAAGLLLLTDPPRSKPPYIFTVFKDKSWYFHVNVIELRWLLI